MFSSPYYHQCLILGTLLLVHPGLDQLSSLQHASTIHHILDLGHLRSILIPGEDENVGVTVIAPRGIGRGRRIHDRSASVNIVTDRMDVCLKRTSQRNEASSRLEGAHLEVGKRSKGRLNRCYPVVVGLIGHIQGIPWNSLLHAIGRAQADNPIDGQLIPGVDEGLSPFLLVCQARGRHGGTSAALLRKKSISVSSCVSMANREDVVITFNVELNHATFYILRLDPQGSRVDAFLLVFIQLIINTNTWNHTSTFLSRPL